MTSLMQSLQHEHGPSQLWIPVSTRSNVAAHVDRHPAVLRVQILKPPDAASIQGCTTMVSCRDEAMPVYPFCQLCVSRVMAPRPTSFTITPWLPLHRFHSFQWSGHWSQEHFWDLQKPVLVNVPKPEKAEFYEIFTQQAALEIIYFCRNHTCVHCGRYNMLACRNALSRLNACFLGILKSMIKFKLLRASLVIC